jgi:septum formation protein
VKPLISQESPLVLASTSRYRAELLGRLGVPFVALAPGVDEAGQPAESPANLAQRLALEKARAVQAREPGRWVLGSDQVASLDGAVLGKPGSRANALVQLRSFSGKSVVFYTAVALVGGDQVLTALDTTIVRFRALGLAEIERYLDAEPAWDCAGAFKAEGLGISLFTAIEARDPTALIGLPLIAVRGLLAQAGFATP